MSRDIASFANQIEIPGLEDILVERKETDITVRVRVKTPATGTDGHFSGNPIVPGFIQLTWVYRLMKLLGLFDGYAFEVKGVKFLEILRGGEKLLFTFKPTADNGCNFEMYSGDSAVTKGSLRRLKEAKL